MEKRAKEALKSGKPSPLLIYGGMVLRSDDSSLNGVKGREIEVIFSSEQEEDEREISSLSPDRI